MLVRTSVVASAILLAACASSGGQATSWGKPGVSMVDYRTDAGQCLVIASTNPAAIDSQGTAGGFRGPDSPQRAGGAESAGASATMPSANPGLPASGLYRDSPPEDFMMRASNQENAQRMREARYRQDALAGCLEQRGYREFRLTPEQRAHLSTLPEGSEARRQYLYGLGTDPAVIAGQGL